MKALFNPKKHTKSMTVQFKSDALTAWVKATKTGLTFALGQSVKPDLVLPITISQLHQGHAEKLFNEYPLLNDFIRCFDTSLPI